MQEDDTRVRGEVVAPHPEVVKPAQVMARADVAATTEKGPLGPAGPLCEMGHGAS